MSSDESEDFTSLKRLDQTAATVAGATSRKGDSSRQLGDTEEAEREQASDEEADRARRTAAHAARAHRLPPPPANWRWQPDVLMADGATAVDRAMERIWSYQTTGGGDSASAQNYSMHMPDLTMPSDQIVVWQGQPIESLCEALQKAEMLVLDCEWLREASAMRPRPGVCFPLPCRTVFAHRPPPSRMASQFPDWVRIFFAPGSPFPLPIDRRAD